MESSNFYNNSGYEGGVLKLENCNIDENWIYNSTFEANFAEGSGGAIFSENSKLSINSS